MSRIPVTIEDGFSKPITRLNPGASPVSSGIDSGNPKHEGGDSKPNGKVQPASSFAGIPLIDPISTEPESVITSDAGNDGFGTGGDSIPRKRRGRPIGSKNRTKTEADSSPLISIKLETLLVSGHLMLSKMIDWDELEIDEAEAKELADAMKEVAKFYVMQVDPKKLAWINLSVVAGGIYVPRIIAAWRAKEAEPKPTASPGPVAVPRNARNTDAATTSQAVKIENTMVDRATAQAWASQGVE